jgi:hypothetical protein
LSSAATDAPDGAEAVPITQDFASSAEMENVQLDLTDNEVSNAARYALEFSI